MFLRWRCALPVFSFKQDRLSTSFVAVVFCPVGGTLWACAKDLSYLSKPCIIFILVFQQVSSKEASPAGINITRHKVHSNGGYLDFRVCLIHFLCQLYHLQPHHSVFLDNRATDLMFFTRSAMIGGFKTYNIYSNFTRMAGHCQFFCKVLYIGNMGFTL